MPGAILALMCLLATDPPQSGSSKNKNSRAQTSVDKAADKILAETKELQVATRWYEDVYPALRRKYGKPVSRQLYDAWRNRYFTNEVKPIMYKHNYNTVVAEQEFMKQTKEQPK